MMNQNCSYVKYRGDHFLMFNHPHREYEKQIVEDQQISRCYDNFVRHRAAKVNVHNFSGEHYISVLVKNHFTERGTSATLIRGTRKGKLHDSFNQNSYNNSQAYGEYRHWRNILRLDNRSRDVPRQQIGYSKVTEIAIPKRPPVDIEEAEEQDRDHQQQQLGQFE